MTANTFQNKISVVIPLYNEEQNIEKIVVEVTNSIARFNEWELILVDDGSTDKTLSIIKKIATQEKQVYFISLSRNFGHQNALRAGLDMATGDAVITMDGDMQHPPELLPEMIKIWQKGAEIVFTLRENTEDLSWFKRQSSVLFYALLNSLSGMQLQAGSADFRLLDRKVVDVLKGFSESTIFYRGLIPWVGFHQQSISYVPHKRLHGKSKYSIRKMLRLAADGMTSFTFLPLRLAAVTGTFVGLLSFLYVFYALYIKFCTSQAISGWLSIMAGVYFLGGIQLVFIGLCGEYIGRIFMEVKGRPHYLISESKQPEFNLAGKK